MKILNRSFLVLQILLVILTCTSVGFAYDSKGEEDFGRILSTDSENFYLDSNQLAVDAKLGDTVRKTDVEAGQGALTNPSDIPPSNTPENKGWLALVALGALATTPVLLSPLPLPFKKTGKERFTPVYVKSRDGGKTLNYYIDESAKPFTEAIKSGANKWREASGVQFKLTKNHQEAQIIYNASSSTDPYAFDANGYPQTLGDLLPAGSNGFAGSVDKLYMQAPSAVTRNSISQSVVTLNPQSAEIIGKNPGFSASQLVTHETGHSLGLADLYEKEAKSNIMFGGHSDVKIDEIKPFQGNVVKIMQTKGLNALEPGSYIVRDQDGYYSSKALYQDPDLLPENQ